jgi:16S rRNA (guanine527-N7)-methyltransferase
VKHPAKALDKLRALEQAYELPEGSGERLLKILLALETEEASVTTVRDPVTAADVHVADSLVALQLPELRAAGRIADLGAGGGFPGLALAVALPAADVTLVESVGRKCDFMTRAAAEAELTNARAVHARAEQWAEGIGENDVVVARALAPLAAIAEYAAPLLRDGGTVIAYKARRDREEEDAGALAADELGLSVGAVIAVDPYPGAGERHLHVFTKTGPTPNRFPRRAGMARKRPLGTAR